MKSILRTYGVLLLAFLLPGMGCKRSSPEAKPEALPEAPKEVQPAETPAATPAGPATRATIGAAGGALKSADGRMEISVPPGALFVDTQVSIQPVAATDLDGIGPEYQLSPEGSNFAQPVTLAWQLSDDDLAGRPITTVIIATRDETGGWTRQPGVERDPGSKTVRVSTTHFSGWKVTWLPYLPDLKIDPAHDEVSVNGSIPLKAVVTRSNPPTNPTILLRRPQRKRTPLHHSLKVAIPTAIFSRPPVLPRESVMTTCSSPPPTAGR